MEVSIKLRKALLCGIRTIIEFYDTNEAKIRA